MSALTLMIASARTDSATSDEGVHLFAGYTYLTQRDYRLDPEHPPLIKALCALPLLLMRDVRVRLDTRWHEAAPFYRDSWKEARLLSEDFLYQWGNDPGRLLFWTRLVPIVLTTLLGLFTFAWARELYGDAAGVLAAFLIVFLPTTLAHGRLVNTDLGVTLFFAIAVFCYGRYLRHPTWRNIFWSGAFTGLAFASKYTAVILVPVFAALMTAHGMRNRPAFRWPRAIGGIALVIAIAFVFVWASYGGSLKAPPPLPASSYAQPPIQHPGLGQLVERSTGILRFLFVPADYFKGIVLLTRHVTIGHDSFLLGMTSNRGWWWYFPVAILVKTPVPLFILLISALVLRRRTRTADPFDELLLIVPAIVYFGIGMTSRANLGVRHMLPIFPFVCVFVSQVVRAIDWTSISVRPIQRSRLPVLAFVSCVGWYGFAAISSYPNYIAYFNELAGGPYGGHRVLLDSNLDWGQDLLRIKQALNGSPSPVGVVYDWSTQAFDYYGIETVALSPADRSFKGTVIASASKLGTAADYAWLNTRSLRQITPGIFLVDLE
jgi:hypothetical protein